MDNTFSIWLGEQSKSSINASYSVDNDESENDEEENEEEIIVKRDSREETIV